eukprot:2321760-Rhodomonas_salina.1
MVCSVSPGPASVRLRVSLAWAWRLGPVWLPVARALSRSVLLLILVNGTRVPGYPPGTVYHCAIDGSHGVCILILIVIILQYSDIP